MLMLPVKPGSLCLIRSHIFKPPKSVIRSVASARLAKLSRCHRTERQSEPHQATRASPASSSTCSPVHTLARTDKLTSVQPASSVDPESVTELAKLSLTAITAPSVQHHESPTGHSASFEAFHCLPKSIIACHPDHDLALFVDQCGALSSSNSAFHLF